MEIQTEQIEWHTDPDDLPDDDAEVLLQTFDEQRWLAYHEDGEWRESSTGLLIDSPAVAWASFNGPDLPEPPEQMDIEDAAA